MHSARRGAEKREGFDNCLTLSSAARSLDGFVGIQGDHGCTAVLAAELGVGRIDKRLDELVRPAAGLPLESLTPRHAPPDQDAVGRPGSRAKVIVDLGTAHVLADIEELAFAHDLVNQPHGIVAITEEGV